MIAAIIFWVACALIVYTLLGYPALIALWARLRPRPVRKGDALPAVSVVLVVHDEAERIRPRIENLLAQDYPPERMDILVCSDGSTDATVARAAEYAASDSRVHVLAFERWRGKPSVLDDVVPLTGGEIVVFADARQQFEAGALRALVAPFADVEVGAVSGELCILPDPKHSAVGAGVGFYWRYEKLMRRAESAVDAGVGATGAIYAIRRALFQTIPTDTLLDDVLIPMQIVRAGYRSVFEPAARAYDHALDAAAGEFARKVRTIAGTFQLFAMHRWLLQPRSNRLWFQTISHKLLRLCGPAALLAILGANLCLLDQMFYRVLLALQLLLYGAALIEHLRVPRGPRGRLSRWVCGVPYAFCVLQAATVMGFVRWLSGGQRVTWKKARV